MINDFYDNPEWKDLGGSSVKCYEVDEGIFNIYFSHGVINNGNTPQHIRNQHFYRVSVKITHENVFYGTFTGTNFGKLKILMEEKATPTVIIGWLISNGFMDIGEAINSIISLANKQGREEQKKIFREAIGIDDEY